MTTDSSIVWVTLLQAKKPCRRMKKELKKEKKKAMFMHIIIYITNILYSREVWKYGSSSSILCTEP